MLLLLFSLFALCIARDCGISFPVEHQEYVGIAPLGKWPWQVYIRTPDKFCGGTIIADRWILTAAHCFDGKQSNRNPIIRVGVVDISASMSDDGYTETDTEHDIALLELDRNITYSSTVSPICLVSADQDVHIDQEGWLIGFGYYIDETTNELVAETSNVLREAHIPLVRHSDCSGTWSNVDKVICAGGKSLGAGQGDSGGPFMLQSVNGTWYQVAVVSFGKEDKDIVKGDTIGGYTSVAHYCDWIEEQTRGDVKCAEKNVEMKEREKKTENENEKEKDENEDPEEEADSDEEIKYIDEEETEEENSHRPSLTKILSIAH